ncbi:hypothetical protein ACVWWR_006846 [Bradyrhizobium sp. LM3.2]
MNGGCHRADFIGALRAGDIFRNIAVGKPRHPCRQVDDRGADAAADHDDKAGAGDQHGEKADESDREAGARG